MKHDRLSILRRQEAARLDNEKADAFYVEATGRSTRYRDDPDYAGKVVVFEGVPWPTMTIGVDLGAPGGDHTAMKRDFQIGDQVRVVEADPGSSLKVGDLYTITSVSTCRWRYIGIDAKRMPCWLPYRFELVEAAPVAPVAEQRYWVCITQNIIGYRAGDVCSEAPHVNQYCWLPCDKDGWITHEPKANSTCPVPVELQQRSSAVKFRNGDIYPSVNGWSWKESGHDGTTIVAWKPVKS